MQQRGRSRHQPPRRAALETLRDGGAHFVLARPDKRPITRDWLNTASSYEAVLSHVRKGGLLGVVASSLGCVVVDIDNGHPSTVINVLGSPLCIVETPRGHHLWYRAPSGEIGNRTWAVNGAHGDIRGSKGSIILWDVAAVAAGLSRVDDAVPADLSKIPRPPSKRTQRRPDAVRAAKPGERNLTLNREVFKAAKAGNFDREAFQKAGVEAGLPLAGVVATIASAEQAGTNAASSRLDINQLGAIIRDEDTGHNKSVYEILVTVINQAKKRRQIFLVTHNPNLAVVADAEQIIHVSIDKKEGKHEFDFFSRSIEEPQVNQAVVDILEGTLPAFDNRRLKYRRPKQPPVLESVTM